MKARYTKLLAIFAVLAAVPFLLNRRIRVARRKLIDATPAEIFPFINDLRNWPLWTEWARKESMHCSYSGPESGAGATQLWETAQMDGALTITQSTQDGHVAYDLDMAGGRCQMHGVIALEPVGGMTRVIWTCSWHANDIPWLRYADLFYKVMIARDFDAGLENLRAIVEERRRA
jgi:hypothetical protein